MDCVKEVEIDMEMNNSKVVTSSPAKKFHQNSEGVHINFEQDITPVKMDKHEGLFLKYV